MDNVRTIRARHGKAAHVKKGQRIKVINTHGTQVVDTWAFNSDNLQEFLSMEHLRATLSRVFVRPGDALVTNRRRPILTVEEDMSPGIHDTLIAACNKERYQLLGCTEYHRNCEDNLLEAFQELGLILPETPSPLNLFMNIPIRPDGAISFEPNHGGKPGDFITFVAAMDLIIAFSACPQDLIPINGADCKPVDAHFEILG